MWTLVKCLAACVDTADELLVETGLTAEFLATSQTFHGDYFSWVEDFVALSAMAKVIFKAFAAVLMLNDTRLSQTEFYSLATGLYTCNFRDLFLDFVNFGLTLKIQISTRFTR
jgi:hypothetical protein